MTAKDNEIQFTVNLETELLERLKAMAEHAGLSRHKLMVNLLTTGIEEIEALEYVGIFQVALIIRNATESKDKADSRKSDENKASEMPIPLRISKAIVDRLDRLADRGDIKRQRLARNILEVGLEELETAKKYGLTHLAKKIRDMHDLFTDVLSMGRQAFFAGKEVKGK
ncbi:hypothetical protein [Trichlorobacter ammonificans]|uniref:Ribbon-helix-helix protein CopG domain-containing protein n=1 Tax=Trichlorobacter ammonificans TaxID=2916410 RepID=A0ABM9DAA8_9BACT|nr:hypothetical protein [Trichlorobacter ammonificans]CAH2031720.1 conserved protein of unknown function [Trichlorobacter ammonificans]